VALRTSGGTVTTAHEITECSLDEHVKSVYTELIVHILASVIRGVDLVCFVVTSYVICLEMV